MGKTILMKPYEIGIYNNNRLYNKHSHTYVHILDSYHNN